MPDPKIGRASLRIENLAAALEQGVDNESAVLDVLVTALAKGNPQPEIWDKLHEAAARDDRMSELAFAYERLCAERRFSAYPAAVQAEALMRAASFFADTFGDPTGARGYLERVVTLAPARADAFAQLEALLTEARESVRLADLYVQTAAHRQDRAEQAALLRKAVKILDAFPDEEERSIKALQQLQKIDPADAAARRALEDRLAKAGRLGEVARMLEQALAADPPLPEAEALAIRSRLIVLYGGELKEVEKALPHVEEVLARDPGNAAAIGVAEALLARRAVAARAAAALEGPYERAGRAKDAAKMLSLQIDAQRGPKRVEAQKRLMELLFQKAGDLAGAYAVCEQILLVEPGDDRVRERYLSLASALDKRQEATKLLGRAGTAAKDKAARARIGVELGELYLELGDPRKARASFQQVLDAAADDGASLRAARALFRLFEHERDTRGLAAMLGRLAELEPEDEAREQAAEQLAQLSEGELKDPAGATAAYRKLLGTKREPLALEALTRLYEETSAPAELADVLERRAERCAIREEARELSLRAAELRTEKLTDRPAAIASWRKFLDAFGPAREVFARLVPLLEQERRWDDLAQALEADAGLAAGPERASVLARLGAIRSTRLHDAVGALQAYRQALAIEPAEKTSRMAVERMLGGAEATPGRASQAPPPPDSLRLAACAVLEPIARAERAAPLLLRVLEVKADLVGADAPPAAAGADPDSVGDLPTWSEIDAGTPKSAPGAVHSAPTKPPPPSWDWESVAEGTVPPPRPPTAPRDLAKLAADGPEPETRRAPLRPEVVEARLAALEEAVGIAEREIKDGRKAVDLAARGLALAAASAPDHVARWADEVERLTASPKEAPRRAAALMGALGERPVDNAALSLLARRAGEALAAGGDVAGALAVYRRALAFEPSSPELIGRVDELLQEQGSPEERITLYTEALSRPCAPSRRRDLLHAIGAIQRRDLGDLAAAALTYRTALQDDPDDGLAYEALLETLAEAGAWDALYNELAGRLSRVPDDERVAHELRMADVAARAGRTDVAAARYRAMLARGAPLGADALTAIEELARSIGDAALLRQVLERRVAVARDPAEEARALARLGDYLADAGPSGEPRDAAAAAEARRRAAALAEGPLADTDRALRLYEQVLAALPADRPAAARLLALYRERGAWAEIPSVSEVLLDTAASAPEALAELAAFEEAAVRAGAVDRLLAAADRIRERFPDLTADQRRAADAAVARALGADPARQDEAAAVHRRLVDTAPDGDLSSLAAFRAFLAASPDTAARREDQRWLHSVLVERAPEGERVAPLAAWAAWEEAEMGDRAAAAALWERVLALDPEHDAALGARARLLLELGDVEGAAAVIAARRDRSEGEARAALELELAALLFDRLDRPADALDALAPAFESGALDPAALQLAVRALGRPEAHARAVELLDRAEAAAGDVEARVQLLETLIDRAAEDRAARLRWFERLLDLHEPDAEQGLAVALRAAASLPGELSLWERAEQLGRRARQPEQVIDAYVAALEAGPALPTDDIEELGRRAVEYHEEWFEAPETTVRLLRRLVELCPGSSWGLERLKLAYNAAERWDDLFALYDQMLERTEDEQERLFLLEDAATVARDLAGDAERTMRYLEALLELSDDARTRTSLERLYERHGRHRPLIKLLSSELPRLPADAAQRLRERIALLWIEGVGEAEAALPVAEEMLDRAPDAKEAFDLLERILDATASAPADEARAAARRRAAELLTGRYRAEDRPADLTRVLEIQADGASADARRALLAEIVRLRRDVLGDEASALDWLSALVELAPAEAAPRAELADLCGRLGRHDRHAEVLASAAGRADDPAVAISLLQEAAAIRRDCLDDEGGAIALLRRLFDLAEQHAQAEDALAALRELDRLLGAAGRVVERCDVLDLLAAREAAPAARREALGELARLSWSVLRDDERAIAAYRARLATDAADLEALDGLVAILEQAGRHRELAAVLDQRAAARGPGDASRLDLGRVARLFERELGDADQAIATWLRIRDELGPDVESGEALAALYAGAGRWADLVELLSVEARAAGDAGDHERAAALSAALGDAHRDHTLAFEQAVAAYRDAWQSARASADRGIEAGAHARAAREGLLALLGRVDPSDDAVRPALVAATSALLDIAAAEDDWRARVALLEPRLAAAPSDAERVQILRESAALLEERGADPAGAFALVWRAFLLAPGPDRPADLLRLADAADRWATLADTLPGLEERGDVPAPTLRDLWRRVAAWQRDAREDADAAERAFERALAHEASSSAILFELAELQRRRPGAALVSTLLRLADATGGDLGLYREAVEVARDAVRDMDRARDIAARLLDLAEERWTDPHGDEAAAEAAALWALDALTALLLAAGERPVVVALCRRGAAMPFPRPEQRRLLRVAADAAELDEAITLYGALFDEDPADEPIGERLAALLAEAGQREALVRHRERQIAVCDDADRRVALRFDAATLLAEAGEVIPSIEALRKNLEELPGHAPSAEKLASLLAEGGNHGDLARLYEEQAALREAAGDRGAAALWLQAAALAERELGDADRAIAAHRRAAALGSAVALDALARLLCARGEPAAAAEALERLCAVTPPESLHVEVLRLADAYVAAHRADRARASIERALGRAESIERALGRAESIERALGRADAAGSAAPRPAARIAAEQPPLRERLRALYREAGEWVALAELIAEDAGLVTEPAARLALLRDAADLHLTRGGSPAAAIPLLEDAIALAPEDLGLRLARCRALGAAGRQADATAALRAMIAEFGARRPKERALVHYELSRVALAGGDRAAAASELDLALRIDPAHPGALLAAANLASEDGHLERASRSYRALLLVARRPRPGTEVHVSRAEILIALADIARRQNEPEREVEQVESAFEAARESEHEHQRLLVALRGRPRHDLLARAIASRLEAPPPEAERVALLEELAALHEGPLEQPEAALDARLQAVSLRPGSAPAHAAALGLAQRLDQVSRYVGALEQLLARSPGSADLLLHLGRALELTGDLAGAADAYRRAEAALDPGDDRLPPVWSALEAIAEKLGDRAAQAGVLERRLAAADAAGAASPDEAPPEVRAEPRYRLAALLAASPDSADRAADVVDQALSILPDPERAEAILRDALRHDPRDERAARLLERVARDTDRPRALVDALVLLADIDDPDRAALGLQEAVQIARRLGERPLAESILTRMIDERAPGASGAIAAAWALCELADVREESGDLAAAADLRERAARASSPEDERALLLRVAALAAGALGDLPRAARLYEELRTREPAEREIWEPLAEVYRKSGDSPRLNALLEETVPLVDTTAERCRLRLERARLLATGHADDAMALLREILDEDASQIEAAILLASMLEAAGRQDELRDLYALQLDAAKDRGDVPSILSLSMRLGALFEQGGDEASALDVYNAAADWDGKSRDVLRAVVRLTQRRDDPPALAEALDKLLQVERGEEAVAVALQLSELRTAQGDERGAEEALEAGYAACPSSDRLREELAGRYTAREAWHKLADLYVREAEEGTDEEKVERLCRAADILGSRAEDAAAAADTLEKALAITPADRDVLLAFIEAATALGQRARAAGAITRTLEVTPDDPALHASRAELHDAEGDEVQALADRERAHALGGKLFAADLIAQLEKNLARAEAEAEAEMESTSDSLPDGTASPRRRARDLRLRLADVLANAGELDRARDHLTELLRKNGKDRDALRTLATLEQSTERWDAAGAVYRRLIALEDGDALVATALKLADACERADRLGDARGGLERALRAAPAHTEVKERLRRLYDVTGAHRELAAMVLEDARAASDVPGRFGLLARAGRLLIDGDDPAQAIAVIEEARALRPDDQEAALLHAEALGASGQLAEARALLTDLIAAHKNRRSKALGAVYQRLARLETLEGKPLDALSALSRAFENDPQNGALAMELAAFATERGEHEIAARAYRSITMMRPAQEGSTDGTTPAARAVAYYHLAAMALAIGDRRKARLMVDKSLGEDPTLEPARALMDELKGG